MKTDLQYVGQNEDGTSGCVKKDKCVVVVTHSKELVKQADSEEKMG